MKAANPKRSQKRSVQRARVTAHGAAATPASADAVVAPPPAEVMRHEVEIALPADSTVRSAAHLKASLLEALPLTETVSLDIAAVERVDTVCLQLLTAFTRDRRQAGRAVAWRGTSVAFQQAASLLGLAGALDIAAMS